jgi:hypothetical protein
MMLLLFCYHYYNSIIQDILLSSKHWMANSNLRYCTLYSKMELAESEVLRFLENLPVPYAVRAL